MNCLTPDRRFFQFIVHSSQFIVLFPFAFRAPAWVPSRVFVLKRDADAAGRLWKCGGYAPVSSGTPLAQPQLTSAYNVHKRSSEDKWGSYEHPEQYLYGRPGD